MNKIAKLFFLLLFLICTGEAFCQQLLVRGDERFKGKQLSEESFKTCEGEVIEIQENDSIHEYDPCIDPDITNTVPEQYFMKGKVTSNDSYPNKIRFRTNAGVNYYFSKSFFNNDSLSLLVKDSLITLQLSFDEELKQKIELIKLQKKIER